MIELSLLRLFGLLLGIIILIWSFRSEVIKQEIKYIKNGGKLIFHLPMLHIIDKNNYKKYLNANFESNSYSIN